MVMDVMGSHKFSPLRWEIRCGKQILHHPFSPIRCSGFWRTCIKNSDVPTRAVCSLPSPLVRTNRKMDQNNKRPKPTIKAEGYSKKYNVSSKLVFMRNSPSPWSVVSSGNYHASLLSQACLIAVFGWLLFSNTRLIRALQIGYGQLWGRVYVIADFHHFSSYFPCSNNPTRPTYLAQETQMVFGWELLFSYSVTYSCLTSRLSHLQLGPAKLGFQELSGSPQP